MHTRRADLESLMYNGLEWLKLMLPWKGKTLPLTIKSKLEMKNEVLNTGPNEKIYNYDKVPLCKHYIYSFFRKVTLLKLG